MSLTHHIATGAILLAACGIAHADVTVNFANQPGTDRLIVSHILLSDLNGSTKVRDNKFVTDTIAINGMTATIPITDKGDARYRVALANAPAATRDYVIDFYTSPGDDLTVAITSDNPLIYTLSGSPLMDGIADIDNRLAPLETQFMKIQTGEIPQDAIEGLSKAYNDILIDYIESNPDSPAAIYAMISLDDEPFDNYYSNLNPTLKTTPLYPFLVADKQERDRRQQLEAKRKALTSGTTPAPDFTLQDLQGKNVSLADFRGKWVVLDFWGSWCIWCIKGFPELKKTYEKYAGKLEIIGIDCGDTKEAWKNAVKKYALPWVNLYNPDGPGNLTETYPVQGFPTKIIISPEGNIVNIYTGEVPDFYTRLAELIQ